MLPFYCFPGCEAFGPSPLEKMSVISNLLEEYVILEFVKLNGFYSVSFRLFCEVKIRGITIITVQLKS